MVKITKRVEYALMALKHMATKEEGELTSAREICDIYKAPFDTTSKVMQIMNSHGLLKSIQGMKGGYVLAKDLSSVNYMDLAEMIEGKPFTMVCEGSNGKTCDLIDTCNIIQPVHQLNFKITEFFKGLSLAELLSVQTWEIQQEEKIHDSIS